MRKLTAPLSADIGGVPVWGLGFGTKFEIVSQAVVWLSVWSKAQKEPSKNRLICCRASKVVSKNHFGFPASALLLLEMALKHLELRGPVHVHSHIGNISCCVLYIVG